MAATSLKRILPAPVRRKLLDVIKSSRVRLRQLTAARRSLPDFIIIGAQKSGTTTLYHCLDNHPKVKSPLRKETHFFDINYKKGIGWYRAHFPLKSQLNSGHRVQEASPYYLFHPLVPRRLGEQLPDVDLIAILRNPVDRAISQYFHEVSNGREHLPIMKALRQENARMRGEKEKLYSNPLRHSRTHQCCSYIQRGIYHRQLARYYQHFDPEQVLVLCAEKFFRNPQPVLRRICTFLDLDTRVAPSSIKAHNRGKYYYQVPTAAYDLLREIYAPHNAKLYEMLGYRMPWSDI